MPTFVIDGSGRAVIEKDPNDVLDYTVDWVNILTPISDTIVSQQIVTTGVTVNSSSFATTKQTAWIAGGTVGERVQVTYRIVTAGGRTFDRSIYLKIKEL